MPIYEYRCTACANEFEELVLPKSTPRCPSCQSEKLERMLSHFGVSSDGTRQNHLQSERKRLAPRQRDKAHAEHEEMHHHHH